MNDALVRTTRPVITLMAQNGGGPTPSRRFTAPGRPVAVSSSPPLPPQLLPSSLAATTTVTPSSSPASLRDRITLAQPRPDGTRLPNYYTETPFRPDKPGHRKGAKDAEDERVPVHLVPGGRVATAPTTTTTMVDFSRPLLLSSSSPQQQQQHHHHLHRHQPPQQLHQPPQQHQQQQPPPFRPVTAQPCVVAFAGKEKKQQQHQQSSAAAATVGPNASPLSTPLSSSSPRLLVGQDHRESILCSECGQCKCEACRNPRRLPSRWICHNNYECSAEALLDTCTCMCCVKALFYHCSKDSEVDDEVSCADKPCSCGPKRRCERWGCMGLLALALPCLLCYWPAKGCVRLCELCYARYHRHGCQCSATATTQRRRQDTIIGGGGDVSPPPSNKRLLDPLVDC